MLVRLLLLFFRPTFSQALYGKYLFSQNLGGLYYDYSEHGYHAINGQEVQVDDNDVYPTDRGVYFTGNSMVQLHNSLWSSPPVLDSSWAVSFWAMPVSAGPLLVRKELGSSGFQFSIILNSNNQFEITIRLCTAGLVCVLFTPVSDSYELAFCKIYTANWSFYTLGFDGGSSTVTLTANEVELLTAQYSLQFYVESSSDTYETVLGTDDSNFFAGYMYMLIFDSSIEISEFTTTGACNGLCYASESYSPYCECEYCVLDTDLYCLSTCLDYTRSSLCEECQECVGICTDSGECLTVTPEDYPVFDIYDINIGSGLCHSDCKGCYGPTAIDCASCQTNYANVTPEGCQCPQFTVLDENSCICDSGSYMAQENGVYVCKDCKYPCEECEGTANNCTACSFDEGVVSNGQCICPSPKVLSGTNCICADGYIESSTGACELCVFPCLYCEDTPDYCTSCQLLYSNLVEGTCECPDHAHYSDLVCECEDGYFLSVLGNGFVCLACDSGCSKCTAEGCHECELTYAHFVYHTCECPEFSDPINGECQCQSGTLLLETNEKYECVECNPECLECDLAPDNCTVCRASLAELVNGKCECPENSDFVLDSCVCDDHFEEVNGKCIYSNLGRAVSVTVVAVAGFGSLLLQNPMSLWNMLNNMDLMAYMPLHNIEIPNLILNFCFTLDIGNLLPSFLERFFEKQYIEEMPIRFKTLGFGAKSVIWHYELPLISAGLLFLLLILVCVLHVGQKFPGTSMLLNNYRYAVPLRYIIQWFLDLSLISTLLVGELVQGQLNMPRVCGGICLGLLVIFVIVLGSCVSIVKPIPTQGKYNTLFDEFDLEKKRFGAYFYLIFLVRRGLLVATLYFLEDFPFIQILLTSLFTAVNFILILLAISYKTKKDHVAAVVSEFSMLCASILYAFFLLELEKAKLQLLSYLIIACASVSISTHLIVMLSNCSVRLYSFYKSRKYTIKSAGNILKSVKRVVPQTPSNLSRSNIKIEL